MCYILNKHETFTNWGRTFCFVCNPNDFVAGQMYETCIRHQNGDFTLVLRAVRHLIEYGIYTFDLAKPSNDYQIFAFPGACTQSVDLVECRRALADAYAINFEWLVHCMQSTDSACPFDCIYSAGFTSLHPYYLNLPSSDISKYFGMREIMHDEHVDAKTKLDWMSRNYERLASDASLRKSQDYDAESPTQSHALAQLTREFKQYTIDSTAQLQQTCEQHEHAMHQLRDDNAQLKHELRQDGPGVVANEATVLALQNQINEQQTTLGQHACEQDLCTQRLRAEHQSEIQQLKVEFEQVKHSHKDLLDQLDSEQTKMLELRCELERCQSEFRLYTKDSSVHLGELESANQTLQQSLRETTHANAQNERDMQQRLHENTHMNEQNERNLQQRLHDTTLANEQNERDLQQRLRETTLVNEQNERTLRETKRMLEVHANSTTSMAAYLSLLAEKESLTHQCAEFDVIRLCLHEKEQVIIDLQAENETLRTTHGVLQNEHALTVEKCDASCAELELAKQTAGQTLEKYNAASVELELVQQTAGQTLEKYDAACVELELVQQTAGRTLEKYNAACVELEQLNQAADQTQEKYDATCVELEQQKQTTDQTLEKYNATCVELEQLKQTTDQTLDTYNATCVELEQLKQTTDQTRDHTLEKYNATCVELEQLKQTADQTLEKYNASCVELAQLKQTAVQTLDKYNAACVELAHLKQTADQTRDQTQDQMRDQTRDQTQDQTRDHQLEKKYNAACAELEQLKHVLQDEIGVHASTTLSLQERACELITIRKECMHAQTQHDATLSELVAVRTELHEHSHHKDVSRSDLCADADFIGKLEDSFLGEKAAHAETSRTLQSQSRDMVAVRQALVTLQRKHDATRSELDARQNELNEVHDHHADVIRTLQVDLVDKLAVSLQVERDAHSETSNSMQVQTRELIATRQTLIQQTVKHDATRAELSSVQTEMREARDHHADVIRTLQVDVVGKLEASLQVERDAHVETSNAMHVQTRELVTTRQACTQLQHRHDATRAELSSLQNDLSEVQGHHADIIRTLQVDVVGKLEASLQVERDAHAKTSNAMQEQGRELINTRQALTHRQLQHDMTLTELEDIRNVRLVNSRETRAADDGRPTDAASRSQAFHPALIGDACDEIGLLAGNAGVDSTFVPNRGREVRQMSTPTELDDTCTIAREDKHFVPSIVELFMTTPELSTLVSVLKLADLETTLSGKGPFTVFAPTNAAFTALNPALRTSLLSPENRNQLRLVIQNHVASGAFRTADDVDTLSGLKTLQGHNLPITRYTNGVFVANVRIIAADLTCANGVVHMVDRFVITRNKHPAFERLKKSVAFSDMWEHPPFSTIRALDMHTIDALADTETLHCVINRVISLLRDSTSVTQMAALLAVYILLRRA